MVTLINPVECAERSSGLEIESQPFLETSRPVGIRICSGRVGLVPGSSLLSPRASGKAEARKNDCFSIDLKPLFWGRRRSGKVASRGLPGGS
jgi:hypothetical protein